MQRDTNVSDETLDEQQLATAMEFAASIRERHRAEDLARLEAYFLSILTREIRPADPRQRPGMGYFPGLRARPWWKPEDSPLTQWLADTLAADFPRLRTELLAQTAEGHGAFTRYTASQRYNTLPGTEWTGVVLFTGAGFTDVATRRFPQAVRALSPLVPYLVGEACYLRLKPGVLLPLHTDASNAQLSCHLGLVVPDGCALEVAGEARAWTEGGVCFFDHSFPHRAWNRSETDRIILLLDVAHPDMTPVEVEVLREAIERLRLQT